MADAFPDAANTIVVGPLLAARTLDALRVHTIRRKLWRAIRGQRLGVSFRRRVPLVDFLAAAEQFVVEVDVGYHSRRRRADERRDEAIRRAGYRVLFSPL